MLVTLTILSCGMEQSHIRQARTDIRQYCRTNCITELWFLVFMSHAIAIYFIIGYCLLEKHYMKMTMAWNL